MALSKKTLAAFAAWAVAWSMPALGQPSPDTPVPSAPILSQPALGGVLQPVTTAYLLDTSKTDDPKLLFGEGRLLEDNSIRFSSMWRIADSEAGCANSDSDQIVEGLSLSDIVMIGAPTAYADASDLVVQVTQRLLLSAGARQVELSDDLLSCQGVFLANYHRLLTE